MKTIFLFKGIIIIVFLLGMYSFSIAQQLVEIHGGVRDNINGNPIENAVVKVNVDGISTILTDVNGNYRIIFKTSNNIILTVTKEGYEPYSKDFSLQENIQADLLLIPQTKPKVSITMTDFVSGKYIKGIVTGFSSNNIKEVKILVYVLTNKWYIHPYASNNEGEGYAKIKANSTWEIKSVWRTYQAYKMALLIVHKNFVPPAVVDGNTDNELLNEIKPEYFNIIEAPEGI